MTCFDPPHRVCTAGVSGWTAATIVSWHRLEAKGTGTLVRKSMQLIGDVPLDLPAGRFACLRYRVRSDEPGEERFYWFARDLPGAPVLYGESRDGVIVHQNRLTHLRRPCNPSRTAVAASARSAAPPGPETELHE